ncbi:MAG: nucleoside triphosphate pyrophosphohydrolase [Patescibacteria group bacterium]|nr:nucleoside triphosphate pyrophosphohydrolase [Patescibacteria group bacterium]
MEKIYHKLVRDKIPEIIKADGAGKPQVRILDDREFIIELLKKLLEEARELIEAKDDKHELVKEIGDVYEVIDAVMEYYKIDKGQVSKLQDERRNQRGGFKKKIFLESVNE